MKYLLIIFLQLFSNVCLADPVFWSSQRKGVNIFNININNELVKNAKKYNVQFVRLAIDKFPTKNRDFLIGDCDNYSGLIKEDLVHLKKVLDIFREEKIPVIITMLSLPGVRWKQHNGNRNDFKIYQDEKFAKQATIFWSDLVKELQDYKDIIVGYNLLNEPRFERFDNIEVCNKKHQNKLFEIYTKIISEIRKTNKDVAIILDVSSDASPECFQYLEPLEDKNVVYSFHMYQPFEYTFSSAKWNKNKGKYKNYPAIIDGKKWDKYKINEHLGDILDWQKKYNISSNKIFVGEFGAERTNIGVDLYFKDLIDIFNKNEWHWAFYSFEEDTWDKMDYELGSQKMSWEYWKKYDKCEKMKFQDEACLNINKQYYRKNKIFEVLKDALSY